MTTKEATLDAGRAEFAQITGTALANWGMLPDQDHLEGGGYHCGCNDIIRIGKWATAGSSKADYSVRQERDRVGSNVCMAIDGPPGWGNGGDAAWIRHNNLLQQALAEGDPELGALRAINYTPDGRVKRRYDTHCRSCGIVISTDTVLWHTHYEFWRNTAGTTLLRRTITRMGAIMRLAIVGMPLVSAEEEVMIIATDGTNTYRSNLMFSVKDPKLQPANMKDLRYVAAQASVKVAQGSGNNEEWDWNGDRRRGFSEAVFGPVLQLEGGTGGNASIEERTVVDALESEAGQAAIVRAANAAEDS